MAVRRQRPQAGERLHMACNVQTHPLPVHIHGSTLPLGGALGHDFALRRGACAGLRCCSGTSGSCSECDA